MLVRCSFIEWANAWIEARSPQTLRLPSLYSSVCHLFVWGVAKHSVCVVILSLSDTGRAICILWPLIWSKWTGCGVGEGIPKRSLACSRRGTRIHTKVCHQRGRLTGLRVDSLACVGGHGWDPGVWKSICLQVEGRRNETQAGIRLLILFLKCKLKAHAIFDTVSGNNWRKILCMRMRGRKEKTMEHQPQVEACQLKPEGWRDVSMC